VLTCGISSSNKKFYRNEGKNRLLNCRKKAQTKTIAFLGFANFEQSKYVLLTVLKVLVHIKTYYAIHETPV